MDMSREHGFPNVGWFRRAGWSWDHVRNQKDDLAWIQSTCLRSFWAYYLFPFSSLL